MADVQQTMSSMSMKKNYFDFMLQFESSAAIWNKIFKKVYHEGYLYESSVPLVLHLLVVVNLSFLEGLLLSFSL